MNSPQHQKLLQEEAAALDANDSLAQFRKEFFIPDGITYLVGHSLGLQSRRAAQFLEEAQRQWKTRAVESWFDPQEDSPLGPWISLENRAGELLAPLLGVNAEDVTIMSGLGVNLMLLLHSLYRPRGKKRKIVLPRHFFPQDRWIIEQHLHLPGNNPDDLLWLEPREGERLLREEDIIGLIEERHSEIALIALEAVSYLSGHLLDIEKVTQTANRHGVNFLLDMAHSAFVTPHELNRWGVDAAVGCSYKFGCSGPGGIGLVYVNKRHWSNPDIWKPGGWWGNNRQTQFVMGPRWEPERGARAWQVSTLPVLTVAPFMASLELFSEATMQAVRSKSLGLMSFAFRVLDQEEHRRVPFSIITPREAFRHASEIVLEFDDGHGAQELKENLRAQGVLVDFRFSPLAGETGNPGARRGLIRAGLHPLFNSYADVCRFGVQLHHAVKGLS